MDSAVPLAIFGCLILGATLHMALRLVYGVRGPVAGDPLYLVLQITSLLLMGLALGAVFLFAAHVFGILLTVIAVAVVIIVHSRNRQMQRRSLLAVVATSVEKGAPLAPTLTALADEYPGSIGRNTRELAQLLEQGVPLAEAIEQRPRALPALAAVYARAGMQIQNPGQALREAAHTQSIQHALWLGVAGRIFYLLWIVGVGISMLTFVMIKIIPAFDAIFSDFGLELPLATKILITASHQFSGILLLLLMLGMMLLVLVAFVFFGLESGWFSRLPLGDRLLNRVHTAVVLRILALASERNRPLEPILQMLGGSYPNGRIARKLRLLCQAVDQGSDWSEALRQQKLIGRPDLAVLQAASRVGNLPWALREMADSGLRRLSLRIQTVVQLVFPLVILFTGFVVMFIVVSLFLPLVKLISSLA